MKFINILSVAFLAIAANAQGNNYYDAVQAGAGTNNFNDLPRMIEEINLYMRDFNNGLFEDTTCDQECVKSLQQTQVLIKWLRNKIQDLCSRNSGHIRYGNFGYGK